MPPAQEDHMPSNNAITRLTESGLKPRLAAILLSLIFPPLGFAMAVYFVVLAMKSRRNKLFLMGVVIILASAIGANIYYNVYSSFVRDREPYSYKYSTLDDYKLSGKLAGKAISF